VSERGIKFEAYFHAEVLILAQTQTTENCLKFNIISFWKGTDRNPWELKTGEVSTLLKLEELQAKIPIIHENKLYLIALSPNALQCWSDVTGECLSSTRPVENLLSLKLEKIGNNKVFFTAQEKESYKSLVFQLDPFKPLPSIDFANDLEEEKHDPGVQCPYLRILIPKICMLIRTIA